MIVLSTRVNVELCDTPQCLARAAYSVCTTRNAAPLSTEVMCVGHASGYKASVKRCKPTGIKVVATRLPRSH